MSNVSFLCFSLMVALWGRVEDVTGDKTLDTYNITMTRQDAVCKWLESVVGAMAKKDMETAALDRNMIAGCLVSLQWSSQHLSELASPVSSGN